MNKPTLLPNDLLPQYQSVYGKRHLTETDMLRNWSDILTAADRRQVTLLGLLDLSAAFDCLDFAATPSHRSWHVGRCARVDSFVFDQ